MRLRLTTSNRDKHDAGFTLLELLVVLVILALLAAIATPQIMKYLRSAKRDTARLQVDALSSSLELYYLDNGRYPSTEEGLKALMTKPAEAQNWNGPYLKHNSSLIDPWGTPYAYRPGGGLEGEVEVKSLGADKAEGGTGDAADITSKH